MMMMMMMMKMMMTMSKQMMNAMQILCGVEVSTEMELSELTRPPTNLKMHQTTFFDDNCDNDDDIDRDYDVLDGDHCCVTGPILMTMMTMAMMIL